MSDFRLMLDGKIEAEKNQVEVFKELLKPLYVLIRLTSADIKNRWSKKNSPTIKPEQVLPLWFDEKEIKPSKPIDPKELEKDRERIRKRYERTNKNKPNA